MKVIVSLKGEDLLFEGQAKEYAKIALDFNNQTSYNSLELLLMSLASCSGATAVSILQKMRKEIRKFTIHAEGEKQTEHPRVFKSIKVRFVLESKDITEEELQKVLKKTEDKYCPVWAMLKNSTQIQVEQEIIR